MRILYLVPYTPTPIRTRPYNLIRSLVKSGHEVILATVWETEAEKQSLELLQRSGLQVITFPLKKSQIFKNFFRFVTSTKPFQAWYSWHPKLANNIIEELADSHSKYDIIHIEHLRGAIYGTQLEKHLFDFPNRIPVVWDSVDNITMLFEQAIQKSASRFGRWITRFELPRTRNYESVLSDRFDRILVTSFADRMAFESIRQARLDRQPRKGRIRSGKSKHQDDPDISSHFEVLTNGVDLDVFSPNREVRKLDTIIFSGKLSYHANVSAALYLINNVMPNVWAHRPGVHLQLVGKDPHPTLQRLAVEDGRIEVTGMVPRIEEYLQQATAAAATLTYGAGVQNKVLEAMACATPVVTTSMALSALKAVPGEHLLVSDNPLGLAEHLINLLDDVSLQKRIGENGRQYVQSCHNWEKITQQLVLTYENAIESNNHFSTMA